jgi:two-component system response regulator PilR (NtrC family)
VVRRVGGNTEDPVDVRIIAATNQDLEARIASGHFREDLFYRINVIPLGLPALRERREDIPLLIEHFVRKYSLATGIPAKRFSSEALRLLESYEWPGNVRELENVVERTLALATDTTVQVADLPPSVRFNSRVERPFSLPDEGIDLEGFLDQVRAQMMAEALERTGGVQTQAADLLGMTFRSFRYYAKKSGLTGRNEEEADAGSP